MSPKFSLQNNNLAKDGGLMGKPDVAVKNWLSHKERFADLFNGYVFGGRQVISPDDLTVMNVESAIIARDKSDKRRDVAVQRFRDIVMLWKNSAVLMVLACESQDKVHYAMPVKNMLYDSLSYTNQMKKIWNSLSEEERKSVNDEEFFSRFRKEDKLQPVITLVFYYGTKEWDGSIELYDMFEFISDADKEVMKNYVPNYRINLVQPTKIEELSLFKTDLQMMFGVLKCSNDKRKIVEYINLNSDYFGSVDIETAQAMSEMLHYSKVADMVRSDDKEEYNMCKALEDLYNDGILEGEMKGKIEGKIGTILDFLSDYGIVPDSLKDKISSEKDIEVLRKWIKLSARVSSVEEFEQKMYI